MSRWPARAFVALAVVMFVIVVLLTPLSGLETRPPAAVHPLGVATLILIFVAAALNAVALGVLGRRPRISAILGAAGLFLVLPSVILDQLGLFSPYSPPAAIRALEFALILVEAALLAASIALFLQRRRSLDGVRSTEST
ncbi:MAG: hypothetical protein L3K23_02890 [Thermoplasmata archaeon]|nr:hypothetical protein [Thermoplasmata archaeon]